MNLRSLPRTAWILCAGTFVNRFGSFVLTFMVLYARRQGLSAGQAGLVVAAYGIGSLPAATVGGFIADRIGRRESIALSMFSSAAALMLLSRAEGLVPLAILTGVVGFTAELYRPAAGALLTDALPPEQRVVGFGMWRLAINAGFALGPAAAGFFAERSFFLLFLGDAVTSAGFGAIALFALPRVKGLGGDYEPGSIRVILADRRLLAFLLASACSAFAYFQMQAALPLQIRDDGLSYVAVGMLLSLNGLAVLFLELPVISITQRLDARKVIATGFVLIGFGFFLTQFAHTVVPLAMTVVIWTLGEVIGAPVGSAYVANLAPEKMRGRYQGSWGLAWALNLVLAPAIGTRVYSQDPAVLWWICGVLGVVAAILVLLPTGGPRFPLVDEPDEAIAPDRVRGP